MFPARGHIDFTESGLQHARPARSSCAPSFANPKGTLRPGQFVRARVSGAVRPNAILVPQRAVLQGSKSHFVWVVDKDSKAHQRVVEVGEWHGDDWFITDGLKPGERDRGRRRDPRRQRDTPLKITEAPPAAPASAPAAAAAARRRARGSDETQSLARRSIRRRPRRTERTGPMNISHFCIDRPIFASVISIVITLGGALAMLSAADRAVSRHHAAADHDLRHLPGRERGRGREQRGRADRAAGQRRGQHDLHELVEFVDGQLTLNAYFKIGTNPELAQVDVQNRVNLALPQLPQSVQAQGMQVQKKSSAFMMVIAIYSPTDRYDSTYIANYANIYVLDALKRIPGANQSSIFGTPDYAMRIWLKPDRMAQLGITAADVQKAVANQNQQFAVGRLGQSPTGAPVEQSFAVTTTGRLTEPAEFDNIIIRAASGGAAIVRLKDIGRAELGQKDYSIRSKFQGKPATVHRGLPAAGRQRARRVEAGARDARGDEEDLSRRASTTSIAMDTTEFTRASISDVVHTFFEAVVLVVIVVFVFLQSLRATLIPVLAVPVSIVGTFMGMMALGFSINMLTLFGMVLAIGIVVDDAIVVIENVERNMTVHKLESEGRGQAGDGRGGGPGRGDRARAVRGVRAGGVPRRHHRAAVQAVRHHHRDLGGDLGPRRADAVAGARRVAAQARAPREEGLLPLVRQRVRADDARLHARGAARHQALRGGAAAVRRA